MRYKMSVLRSCCLCFSTRTGSFVLGSLGIIIGATLLAPMAVFLDYHSYYITQFVASERVGGNYIDDDQVPKMEFFSKMLFSVLLSLDVIFVLSCVLLLAGIAGTRHLLMLPWLIFTGCAIVVQITIVISFMIAVADYGAVAIFLGSSPGLGLVIYLWFVVYAAYQMIRKADSTRRGTQVDSATGPSVSQSSLSSLKEGLHRVIGGTPPPPYEAVTTKSSPRQANLCKTSSVAPSSSSCSDLLPPSSASSPSSSRRASERSTKPSSPVSLPPQPSISSLGCKTTVPKTPSPISKGKPPSPCSKTSSPSSTNLPLCPSVSLTSSRSHSHICPSQQQPPIKRSQSTTQATQVENRTCLKMQEPLVPKNVQSPAVLVRQEAVVEVSSASLLSDDTSSMSSTSLSLPDQNLLC